MFSRDDIESLVDARVRVRASDGHSLGRLGATVVVVDAQGQPQWVSVQTGLLGAFRAFIPLRGARIDGTELLVPHAREQITSAPLVAEDGHLQPEGRTKTSQSLRHQHIIPEAGKETRQAFWICPHNPEGTSEFSRLAAWRVCGNGYCDRVRSFEAEALINARSATVWDVITDTGNLTVWPSGITWIDGEPSDGVVIRVKTVRSGDRVVRTRVELLPGEVMIWRSGLLLGLLTVTRSYALSPQARLTCFRVREEFSGLLPRFSDRAVPDAGQELNDLVGAVKARAELLDRTTSIPTKRRPLPGPPAVPPGRLRGCSTRVSAGTGALTPGNAKSTLWGMSEESKEPLVGRVVERLAASYPETPRAHIEGIVADEYHALNGGRIRTYIPILVERGARNRLHRESPHHRPDH